MDGIAYTLDPDLVAQNGTLQAICSKVIDYLQAVPQLAVIKNIFSEDSKTLEQDINRALRGTSPISLVVSLGDCKDSASGLPNVIRYDPVEIIVTVIEQPTLNRGRGGSGLTINRAAEIVACKLKGERIENAFFTKADLRAQSEDLGTAVAKNVVLTISASVDAS